MRRYFANMLNVPNILTIFRVLLIPVFLWLFRLDRMMAALFVFLLAGATDFLDGYIARRWRLVTDFGKLMDPLADKLMLVAVLGALLVKGWVAPWVLITVVVKELLMLLAGAWMLRKGIVVSSAMIGKVTTALFIAAVTVTFFHPHTAPYDGYLQTAAVALTLCAIVWYGVHAVKQLRAAARGGA